MENTEKQSDITYFFYIGLWYWNISYSSNSSWSFHTADRYDRQLGIFLNRMVR